MFISIYYVCIFVQYHQMAIPASAQPKRDTAKTLIIGAIICMHTSSSFSISAFHHCHFTWNVYHSNYIHITTVSLQVLCIVLRTCIYLYLSSLLVYTHCTSLSVCKYYHFTSACTVS